MLMFLVWSNADGPLAIVHAANKHDAQLLFISSTANNGHDMEHFTDVESKHYLEVYVLNNVPLVSMIGEVMTGGRFVYHVQTKPLAEVPQ